MPPIPKHSGCGGGVPGGAGCAAGRLRAKTQLSRFLSASADLGSLWALFPIVKGPVCARAVYKDVTFSQCKTFLITWIKIFGQG